MTFGIENRPEVLDSISILNESTSEQITIHGTDTLVLVYVDTTNPDDPDDPEDPSFLDKNQNTNSSLTIYPNPSDGDAFVEFYSAHR